MEWWLGAGGCLEFDSSGWGGGPPKLAGPVKPFPPPQAGTCNQKGAKLFAVAGGVCHPTCLPAIGDAGSFPGKALRCPQAPTPFPPPGGGVGKQGPGPVVRCGVDAGVAVQQRAAGVPVARLGGSGGPWQTNRRRPEGGSARLTPPPALWDEWPKYLGTPSAPRCQLP